MTHSIKLARRKKIAKTFQYLGVTIGVLGTICFLVAVQTAKPVYLYSGFIALVVEIAVHGATNTYLKR